MPPTPIPAGVRARLLAVTASAWSLPLTPTAHAKGAQPAARESCARPDPDVLASGGRPGRRAAQTTSGVAAPSMLIDTPVM